MTRTLRSARRVALCALLLAPPPNLAAATDPGLNGPFTAGKQTIPVPATQGATLSTDVHFPRSGSGGVDPAAGSCPVVVFGHGFSRSKEQYVNVGAHLATRGYVVLIPNFSGSDHSRNADDMSAMVDWILARNSDPGSIFHGRINPSAIGVSGHSAGGLSSIVAASRDGRIRAVAPRDPVDSGGLGTAALANVRVSVAITYSEDSSCNANGSSRVLYAAALPPKRGVKIVGATHCDPEEPTNFLCTLVCGGVSATRQALYRRYVTGWFEFYLRSDPAYEPWVFGNEVQADVAAGRITYEASPAPPGEVANLRLAKSGGQVTFVWDALAAYQAVTDYRVYHSAAPDFSGAALAGTSAQPIWSEPLGSPPTTAFFKVSAVNASGEGPL